MGDRRLRRDAVAEVEDVRQALGGGQHRVDRRVEGRARPRSGSRDGCCPASPCVAGTRSRRALRSTDQSTPTASAPVSGTTRAWPSRPGAAGEHDDLGARHPGTDAGDHPGDGLERPAGQGVARRRASGSALSETSSTGSDAGLAGGRRVGQRAGMGFEDLHRVGAGLELAHEVLGLHRDEAVDQRVHQGGVGLGQRPGGGEVRACRARRSCSSPPSRARRRSRAAWSRAGSSARRRRTVSKTGARWAKIAGSPASRRRSNSARPARRIEARPLALDEAHVLAERVRDHEDVGEQDRGVEAEAPDRLQRHLGGEVRVVAEVEEGAGLWPGPRPVFRQVAPGLAHHPGGGRAERLARENPQDRPVRTRPCNCLAHPISDVPFPDAGT